jgi:hypothetical protein
MNMNEELIECPCCGKKVPANDVELTFKRPDEIAAMSEEDVNDFCLYNEEIYNYRNEKHYIRSLLPLPVLEKEDRYCLGVWVHVSKNDYQTIYDTWEEQDLTHMAPIQCSLANDIPLHENTNGLEIELQLMGKTRPEVIIKDSSSSLYAEQRKGITIHRASEYSDICR